MDPTKSTLPVRSGTTTERLLRTALLAVVISGFAVAFLWDGYFGYSRDNVDKLVTSLGLSLDPMPAVDTDLTRELGRSVVDAQAELAALGEPALQNGDDAYYIGPAGHIKTRSNGGKIVSIEWVDGTHSTTDLSFQRGIGYVLGLLGLLSLVQFLRVAATRAVLCENGLKIRGKPLITLDAMIALRDERQSGGTVEIEYRDGDQAGSVKLDSYVYRGRDAIIEGICAAKGFGNPLKPKEAPRQA